MCSGLSPLTKQPWAATSSWLQPDPSSCPVQGCRQGRRGTLAHTGLSGEQHAPTPQGHMWMGGSGAGPRACGLLQGESHGGCASWCQPGVRALNDQPGATPHSTPSWPRGRQLQVPGSLEKPVAARQRFRPGPPAGCGRCHGSVNGVGQETQALQGQGGLTWEGEKGHPRAWGHRLVADLA